MGVLQAVAGCCNLLPATTAPQKRHVLPLEIRFPPPPLPPTFTNGHRQSSSLLRRTSFDKFALLQHELTAPIAVTRQLVRVHRRPAVSVFFSSLGSTPVTKVTPWDTGANFHRLHGPWGPKWLQAGRIRDTRRTGGLRAGARVRLWKRPWMAGGTC